jgi:hypothetical protein
MSKKSFPIFTPVVDAFRGFGKNWLLFLCAGALMSSIHLFDRHLMPSGSGKLYQEIKQVVRKDLPNSKSAQEFFNHIGNLRSFFRGHPEPLKYYGYGLGFSALMLFLLFGFIGICLSLGGKKKASLSGFLPSGRQYARFLGALVIVGGLFFVFAAGLDALDVALSWFGLPLSYKLLSGFVALLVFLVYIMHFAFIAWCAADKSKGVCATLSCSVNLMRGNVMRVIAFALLFTFVMGLCREVAFMLLSYLPVVPVPGFSVFLVGTVICPISIMGWTAAYKHLK